MRIFLPLLLLLAACQTSMSPNEKSVGATVPSSMPNLAADPRGAQWQLFLLGLRPMTLSAQEPIYLQLSATETRPWATPVAPIPGHVRAGHRPG